MLMWLRMAPALHLIFLLIIHRVSAADWGVIYSPSQICALKNSTMTISCTFTYPTPGYQIMNVFWNIDQVKQGGEFADLSNNSEYSQRLQYLGDKQQNCTVRLSHVTKKDEHDYYFKFITDVPGGMWLGIPGVRLSVTDLQLESPERVTEGDSVRLTCNSSCNLTDTPTFIWYRNSDTLTNIGDKLIFRSVSRREAGHYSCGVQGQTYISPAVYLDVSYAPDTPVISNRSAVIMSGDSVTLNCSSDSNPPADFYWFKGKTFIGSGGIFNISKISSDDSGEYKCIARNDHGVKFSDPVTLNVQYAPDTPVISISGPAVIMEGDSVTLSCSSDSNPPALNFSWFKGETFGQSGKIFNISKISSDDSKKYKCRARNDLGEKYSDPVTLDVQYPPKNISVSISGSAVMMSGDSVTLSCSSDSNPPAEINWFKGETFVGSGRIFNISKISSDDSGEYKCRARNEHGEKYSDPVTLDVQYPPRNVSVSVTDSDQLWFDSVSLMCISDSNPPALNFSWFKENQSSAVGSGQSFSAVQSGRFYCEAHNPHGAQRSDAVTVTVHQHAVRNIIIITATAVAILIIIIIVIIVLLIIKKQRSVKSEGLTVTQNDLYSDVSQKVQAHDNPVCDPGLADEAPYETVNPRISAECRDAEEIQYATVQYHKNTQMKREEEEEQRQCDNIPVQQPDQDHRQENVQTAEESVIYSMLK
ncbi:B-cell receptor CD22-like [Danio aesculapii]|uniref:B-cell receptor CD22-like n=1 Tax=Danio aesculapii TaxID=1142201 RepID=UPI0024BF2F21|nr:B-cell receptor CD22-like [Danio aesculapii]